MRKIANRLVDDPAYQDALRQRMINGSAGSVEVLMWHYAHGKPVERVETGKPGAFTELNNDQLRERLLAALTDL